MGFWFDNDGLYRQFGVTKAVPEVGGDYHREGEYRILEYFLDLTTLTPFTTVVIPSNTAFIQNGIFVESVDVIVETAGAGATATLNIGLINNDRATVDSATGFVNAMTVATLVQGANLHLVVGSAFVGGYVGAAAGTPVTGYLIATANTANFTAGKIRVRINYRTPTQTTITQ